MQAVLILYWALGILWVATGFLPKPFGWLQHNMPPSGIVVMILLYSTIWPLMVARIVVDLFHGRDNTDF